MANKKSTDIASPLIDAVQATIAKLKEDNIPVTSATIMGNICLLTGEILEFLAKED